MQHAERYNIEEPIIAEFKAIIKAVTYVRDRFTEEQIIVYTDCHSIAEMSNGDASPSRKDIQEYVWKLQQFKDVYIKYIERENNRCADRLSRQIFS